MTEDKDKKDKNVEEVQEETGTRAPVIKDEKVQEAKTGTSVSDMPSAMAPPFSMPPPNALMLTSEALLACRTEQAENPTPAKSQACVRLQQAFQLLDGEK